jgi:putative SOS response-associated peptidase YedK
VSGKSPTHLSTKSQGKLPNSPLSKQVASRSSLKTGFAVTCRDSSGIRQRYPYWAKDPSIGLRTINAKAETITTAPAFREAIKYRRCLVPADAFYEWQKLDAKTKQPFAIAMKDRKPYALAGLWEKWKDRKMSTELLTFTVITTDPNDVVQPLDDRMPVIIPERDYDRWLQPGDPDRPPIESAAAF